MFLNRIYFVAHDRFQEYIAMLHFACGLITWKSYLCRYALSKKYKLLVIKRNDIIINSNLLFLFKQTKNSFLE